jgi:transcriptional regulator with XRE-family HTH domain
MINAEQLRAARGLLDWKTSDLAKLSSLTVNGINKIERGYVQGRRDTMETLQRIFEEAGLEFLPGSGVRKKDRIITTHEGEGAQQNLLNDVYNTLADTGGEVLIAHVDETIAINDLSQEFLDQHIKRLKAANITERMLIRVGNHHIVTSPNDYRAIPEEYFIATPMFIYGEKLALLSWNPTPRAVILHDARFAESARRLFNYVWDKAQVLPSSTKGKRA